MSPFSINTEHIQHYYLKISAVYLVVVDHHQHDLGYRATVHCRLQSEVHQEGDPFE